MRKLMVSYRVELIDGTVRRGSFAVPADSADAAVRLAVSLLQGNNPKYARPAVFDFYPNEVEDVTVVVIGPA